MTQEYFDDEILMSFADGELDDATSSRLETALEQDDELAARLAVFLDSREIVAAELKPLIHEPVPAALMASVRRMADEAQQHDGGPKKSEPLQDNVVSFRSRADRPAAAPPRRWLMPAAAAIVAILAGTGGFFAGRGIDGATPSFDVAVIAGLDRETSGSDVSLGSSGEVLHLVASFQDGRGDLCREYEVRRPQATTLAVACRQAGTWVSRLTLTTPRADGYVPASTQETVDAYLSSIQAGSPLSPEQEKVALTRQAD